MERLLRALVSLGAKGHSFTPDNLCDHFGSDGQIALDGIANIYQAISTTDSAKALTFFKQWQILFGEVCGYDVRGRNPKIEKLGEHYSIPSAQPAELLFAVHTYYGILIKLLATEIVSSFSPLGSSTLKRLVAAHNFSKLRTELKSLEQGGIWSHLGIHNFLEGDLFAWYLDAWDERCAEAVRAMVLTLDQYDATTLSVEPAESRDLLKKLYQHLFPKSVRHDLGEYYTPDWLAELTLDELGYDGDPDRRILDPACGSGTFLVMIINRVKAWFAQHRYECGFGEEELVCKILRNVIGFDLNPLAVMAARTNYLLAIRDLRRHLADIELPVYLCDSVMTPSEYGLASNGQYDILSPDGQAVVHVGKARELRTAAGKFLIPSEIARSQEVTAKYADTLEFCVRNKYEPEDFLIRCEEEGVSTHDKQLHRALFEQLCDLDRNNQNGVWARIIKNAFAPLFIGPVDYVAGNPPWVNWESLPEGYKQDVRETMQEYGLMRAEGWAARLGSAKYDLAMLFVYVSIDKYLSRSGRLGFVITQSVFQSDAGSGFREFSFGSERKKTSFAPLVVHDMTAFQPFEMASNRTAVVVFRKSSSADFPVPYRVWRRVEPISSDLSLNDVLKRVEIDLVDARPVDVSDASSRWFVGDDADIQQAERLLGKSDYTAEMGSNTEGANGVYWVNILEKAGPGCVLAQNIIKRTKRPVPQVTERIEVKFLSPLVRSGDMRRWNYELQAYLIFMSKHRLELIREAKMKQECPYLYSYFTQFRDVLETRKSFAGKMKKQGYPFYAMYGAATMEAPYKVAWKRIGSTVDAVVLEAFDDEYLGKVPPIPQETIIFVPLRSKDEAHYLCSMLNSPMVTTVAQKYSLKGSKSFASVHLLENIRIPRYEPQNGLHTELSELSIVCHKAAKKGETEKIEAAEKNMGKLAARVWGIGTAHS